MESRRARLRSGSYVDIDGGRVGCRKEALLSRAYSTAAAAIQRDSYMQIVFTHRWERDDEGGERKRENTRRRDGCTLSLPASRRVVG